MGESVTGGAQINALDHDTGAPVSVHVVFTVASNDPNAVIPKLSIEALVNSFVRSARDCGLRPLIFKDNGNTPWDFHTDGADWHF